ncbi:MAG: DUF4433 domain-containing protein [Chitinophagaceae bacterium]|nr:DUF4433 domain-containing protein [Chitinophagaceae bacterium]
MYRIIPLTNLEAILEHGIFCKNDKTIDPAIFVSIGNREVIEQRGRAVVKCYPDTYVNDYVPFYFSVRTPMLFNIKTGWGVPKYPQENIVYLCYSISDLATENYQWCYTDGNAAKEISKFYTELNQIKTNIDWRAINTRDFSRDRDTIRKKHAEFLVKGHVPNSLIKRIVVLNNDKKMEVEGILKQKRIDIPVTFNPQYYFE